MNDEQWELYMNGIDMLRDIIKEHVDPADIVQLDMDPDNLSDDDVMELLKSLKNKG